MNDYTFGNFIYELRKEKRISQSELGDRMGISNKAVSKWEMGIAKPRPAMLVALAGYFGVTVEELMAGRRMSSRAEQTEETPQGGIEESQALPTPDAENANNSMVREAIGVQIKECKRKARWAKIWAVIFGMVPAILVIYLLILAACGAIEASWAAVPGVILVLFWPVSFVIFLSLLYSSRRQKRMLYTTFPSHEKEIVAQMICRKRPTRTCSNDETISEAIDSAMEAYKHMMRDMNIWAIVFATLPMGLLVYAAIVKACGAFGAAWAPAPAVVFVPLWPVSFVMIFVFFARAGRQKRILYATFPEREEEIKERFAQSKRLQYQLSRKEKGASIAVCAGALFLNILSILNQYFAYPVWLVIVLVTIASAWVMFAIGYAVVLIVRGIRFRKNAQKQSEEK